MLNTVQNGIYMKNIGLLILLFTSFVVNAQDEVKVIVAHTNDTHSCVMPITPNYADTVQADKGGFLRRVVLIDSLRKIEPQMLLFDCGDFSQGSPYYNIFKGDVEVALMNRMKYDACTIGNHEFDYGLNNMVRVFRDMDFPVVCCNYDFTGTVAEGVVKPYVVLERNGVKIGVLGVSPKLEGLVAKDNYEGVDYLDPVECVNKVAEHLKCNESCDLVICLSHLGWNIDGMDDKKLIESTRNIDILLGGHTHTYMERPEYVANAEGVSVLCNQMGKNARFVGTLTITMAEIDGCDDKK